MTKDVIETADRFRVPLPMLEMKHTEFTNFLGSLEDLIEFERPHEAKDQTVNYELKPLMMYFLGRHKDGRINHAIHREVSDDLYREIHKESLNVFQHLEDLIRDLSR